MASRIANPRRAATRPRANDENAVPVTRTKSAVAGLGPPAKSSVVAGASAPAAQAGVPLKKAIVASVKAGAKRTVLGGVVESVQVKAEAKPDKLALAKGGKTVEARQPLGSRQQNGAQSNAAQRVIAPVPTRQKPAVQPYMQTIKSETDVSEMDVDVRREVEAEENDGLEAGMSEDEAVGEDEELDEPEMEDEEDEEDWLRTTEDEAARAIMELEAVRSRFVDDVDLFDTTMVAEYAEDIFEYMEKLELTTMPNPRYMDFQTEIEWTMRTTLIDWLLQVHLRYHMLPETLWIAVNLVDRFLSARVVSLVKLQLVGVTAMFIAAKYEEILAPSVEEFAFMTENGYTKEEILKGERIILQTLDFSISSYCSPYSWVRRISKADDYDIQTRTLSKFLMEVTLLDHRFLRCRPSMIAAIGMYLARKMLGGDWDDAFVFYSNYTEDQLATGANLLCERLCEHDFETVFVYKKYSNKKFLRASSFARDWALSAAAEGWCNVAE